ncbi:MAG: hypothetical protein QXW70_01880 [Candidatus Anstonellales archaeon]
MLLYFYDLKAKDLRLYNNIKRRFYYELSTSKLTQAFFRTKSVLVVPDELETYADNFFKKYSEYLEVYKARTRLILQIN